MTNQDLTNIKETIEWMLENGDFKDAETSYNCATNSINTLKEAISVTRCCDKVCPDPTHHAMEIGLMDSCATCGATS
tara:strand:- start:195 stop:425 length:231 start_codon:yes stop_codon:yes gene_type:complete